MSEGQKVRFAKLRLVGSAKKYWQGIQKQLEHLGQEPITLWAEMKLRLKEKYLPPSYKNLLLDQLLNLKQASSSVTDYLTRFEDLRVRCEIKEEPCVATARFINGLKFKIKREVNVHSVTTLEEAYHKALEFETYFSSPPRRRSTPFENFQPPQSTSLESASSLPRAPQGIKSFKPGSNPSSSSQIECFNCHAKGHIASCCLTSTLALTEELDTPPINEHDVEIVEPLEDYDDLGLDNLVGHNVGLLGVIRCIPTHEFDSESLSFGPTLSLQKLSAHPIGLGSTAYLLNLPTNLTIASMTMAVLYFIRGTFEPPWGVCDVSTYLAFSIAALAIHICDFYWKEVIKWCEDFLNDFNNLILGNKVCNWVPPKEGMYKANCATSVDKIRGRIGFGVVIRNCNEDVMASCAHMEKANLRLKSAKLTAMYKSILFSSDCGLAPFPLRQMRLMLLNGLWMAITESRITV
ncbi:hypothetical protein LWI29_019379 [Acer saccharum]|uniref:Retrotransposon gag domain-containing protein n=1 Tax=Acer saccharum TaxID=4024 RepID=A0AA39ST71_ACESA|nr:hypothetical protein LWI29_019379 [Acer saccharum]